MGEELNPSPDEQVMPYIHWANVACGGHAGSYDSMVCVLELAQKYDVAVGAHPSYPDRDNFGRRSMPFDAKNYEEQVRRFEFLTFDLDMQMNHIKPHGALYNDVMKDMRLLEALMAVHGRYWPHIPLVLQGGVNDPILQALGHQYGVRIHYEYFADRAYESSGLLRPRSLPNAVFGDAETILAQFKALKRVPQAHTVCFHSDNPASVQALKQL